MSHFTVAVFTKTGTEEEVDRLLAPYQENSMGDCWYQPRAQAYAERRLFSGAAGTKMTNTTAAWWQTLTSMPWSSADAKT